MICTANLLHRVKNHYVIPYSASQLYGHFSAAKAVILFVILDGESMLIKNHTITFDNWDLQFVKRFGEQNAVEMVLDFKSCNPNMPFIYDTYQLAHYLKVGNKTLFDILKHCDEHYHFVSIPKRSRGMRKLCVPDEPLKQIQRSILKELLMLLPVSRYATAYFAYSKLIDNAAPHVGHRYLLKLDLSVFFGSIRFDMVFSAAFNTRLFSKQIGAVLTTLCCKDDTLPQGAPTSPAISNLVMKQFDDNFGSWCETKGFTYTRYCDDITISGNSSLYLAYLKASRWLTGMGFEVNEQKTHFLSNANRQIVTGLTVNEKISVPKDYKRKLRQELYYAQKFGIENVIIHKGLADFITDGKADIVRYKAYLLGKINYILSIEPDNTYFAQAKTILNK